jgi:hypothetical protein
MNGYVRSLLLRHNEGCWEEFVYCSKYTRWEIVNGVLSIVLQILFPSSLLLLYCSVKVLKLCAPSGGYGQ